jgi:hypothetical protein
VTPDQVKAALVRRIDPSKLVLVAAGDLQEKSGDANGNVAIPTASPVRRLTTP